MNALDLAECMLKKFGFNEYKVELSTRDPSSPEKYMGSDIEWMTAQEALIKALERKGIPYVEMKGEAVFYGPKIDVKILDSYGREWQCSTIQFDFNLPKRFNLTYVGSDGKKHRPLMIHRALLGSIERFFGILIEHYRGNLPTWLAPVQVKVLSISNKYDWYAEEIYRSLSAHGIRCELDTSSSTISYKVREAETQKIPYIVVCGRRELEFKTVSVRKHGYKEVWSTSLKELVRLIKEETR